MNLLKRFFESPESRSARLAAEAAVTAARRVAETLQRSSEQLDGGTSDSSMVEAAVRLAAMPEGMPVLLAVFGEDRYSRRETMTAAAIGLVEVGRPAVEHLSRLIPSRNYQVVILAVSALADIADPSAFEPLATFLRCGELFHHGSNSDARRAAVLGLGNIGDERAVQLLTLIGENVGPQYSDPPRTSYVDDEHIDVRRAAYAALACIGSPLAVQAIRSAASSNDRVSAAATELIAKTTEQLPSLTRRHVRVLPALKRPSD